MLFPVLRRPRSGYTCTLNNSCVMSIFRSGHLKLPRVIFKNQNNGFCCCVGKRCCVKLREAAQGASEEWSGKSGGLSRSTTTRRPDILLKTHHPAVNSFNKPPFLHRRHIVPGFLSYFYPSHDPALRIFFNLLTLITAELPPLGQCYSGNL